MYVREYIFFRFLLEHGDLERGYMVFQEAEDNQLIRASGPGWQKKKKSQQFIKEEINKRHDLSHQPCLSEFTRELRTQSFTACHLDLARNLPTVPSRKE